MKHNEAQRITVSADIGLFLYLQEKVCERKTKTEAYCNLLKKTSENFVSPILKNRSQQLGAYQCHVTITDLSVEWHWHRSTVRSFLEKLEEYGQVEIVRLPKSFIITMPVGTNNADNPVGTQDFGFSSKLHEVLSDWIADGVSIPVTGEKCIQLLKTEMACFSEAYKKEHPNDTDGLKQALKSHFESAKQQLLEQMAVATFKKVIRKHYAVKGNEAMTLFYDNDLGCDSEALLEASQILAELLVCGISPSLTHETPQTKAQFENLLESYKALLAQSIGHADHL